MMAEPFVQRLYHIIQETREAWLTEVLGATIFDLVDEDNKATGNPSDGSLGFSHPHCIYEYPVFERTGDRTSPLVGMLHGVLRWDYYLQSLLP